jgi:hypothetical protein
VIPDKFLPNADEERTVTLTRAEALALCAEFDRVEPPDPDDKSCYVGLYNAMGSATKKLFETFDLQNVWHPWMVGE